MFLRTSSIVIAAAVGTSLLAAATMQTGQQQDRQDRQQQNVEREVQTLEGRIVDLHHYLTLEDTPDMGDPAIAGENFGGPVALLVEEDRMIRGARTVLYVLVAAPERDEAPRDRENRLAPRGPNVDEHDRIHQDKKNAKHEQAKSMTGKMVRITGKQLERDGVKALEIRQIVEGPARAPQTPQDRDRDRDRPRLPSR
jgi:hypothetical protein